MHKTTLIKTSAPNNKMTNKIMNKSASVEFKEIENWLTKRGIDFKKYQEDKIYIITNIKHTQATYSVTIKRSGMWLSYTAELMRDVQGQKVDEFYKLLLNINSRLNAAYIATQQNRLILIRNEFSEDISEENLLRGLAVFHRTHEYIYDTILKKANELHLNLKE